MTLTDGDYLQGDKVIYFFNLDSFKFLFSLATPLPGIFSGPHSYQSFNPSRAICNCVYRLRVELFLFYNWPLRAEKPLGNQEGQPGNVNVGRNGAKGKFLLNVNTFACAECDWLGCFGHAYLQYVHLYV